MFRNLTTGQWVTFVVLTFFTIFGGFLYVAVEAYYNRADRATGALPAVAAPAAPVAPTPSAPMSDNFKTAVYAIILFLLGALLVQHGLHS